MAFELPPDTDNLSHAAWLRGVEAVLGDTKAPDMKPDIDSDATLAPIIPIDRNDLIEMMAKGHSDQLPVTTTEAEYNDWLAREQLRVRDRWNACQLLESIHEQLGGTILKQYDPPTLSRVLDNQPLSDLADLLAHAVPNTTNIYDRENHDNKVRDFVCKFIEQTHKLRLNPTDFKPVEPLVFSVYTLEAGFNKGIFNQEHVAAYHESRQKHNTSYLQSEAIF